MKLKSIEYSPTEKEIEDSILNYLDFKGFVSKIHRGGKPVKNKFGQVLLIPFGNKHVKKLVDIYFLYKGKSFWFEVKTEKEFIYFQKKSTYLKNNSLKLIKEKKLIHLKEQYDFIESVKKNGGYGGFVWSIECVKKIISDALFVEGQPNDITSHQENQAEQITQKI